MVDIQVRAFFTTLTHERSKTKSALYFTCHPHVSDSRTGSYILEQTKVIISINVNVYGVTIAVEGASVGVIGSNDVLIRQRQVGIQYDIHVLFSLGTFHGIAERRPVSLTVYGIKVVGCPVIRLREVTVGDGEVVAVAHTCPGVASAVPRIYL